MSRVLRARAAGGVPRRARSVARLVFDVVLAIVILALLGLLALRLDRVERREVGGSATVHDGDTLTVAGARVRLRGIDAPEYAQQCGRPGGERYACGRQARDALRSAIGENPVVCEGWQRDRFGRLLGDCRAGGVVLNRRLVEEGWAVAYGDFESEENAAREARRGLWSGSFDRPREWRDTHGGMAESAHTALSAFGNWLRQMLRTN